jgi:hypothetical protein
MPIHTYCEQNRSGNIQLSTKSDPMGEKDLFHSRLSLTFKYKNTSQSSPFLASVGQSSTRKSYFLEITYKIDDSPLLIVIPDSS